MTRRRADFTHFNRLKRSFHSRSTSSECTLYIYPTSTTTLPVFTSITLTWNPSCLSSSSPPANIDLYLETLTNETTVMAVHEWTGIQFSLGKLVTQLDPGWWNASTGAGQVEAQFLMTASGSPIWETIAPVGPAFQISYNGSYPSVTPTAFSPIYTGPSVQSVSNPSSGIGSSHLAAAVAVPLLVVLSVVLGYVGWNKWRKRPEKKRWSAVIDKRMSQISQGTWTPPRGGSMAGSRPNSHYSQTGMRPSSHYSQNGGTRPGSHYSQHSHSHYSHSHRPSDSISRSPLAPPGSPNFQRTHQTQHSISSFRSLPYISSGTAPLPSSPSRPPLTSSLSSSGGSRRPPLSVSQSHGPFSAETLLAMSQSMEAERRAGGLPISHGHGDRNSFGGGSLGGGRISFAESETGRPTSLFNLPYLPVPAATNPSKLHKPNHLPHHQQHKAHASLSALPPYTSLMTKSTSTPILSKLTSSTGSTGEHNLGVERLLFNSQSSTSSISRNSNKHARQKSHLSTSLMELGNEAEDIAEEDAFGSSPIPLPTELGSPDLSISTSSSSEADSTKKSSSMEGFMPKLSISSEGARRVFSPDELLERYAVKRESGVSSKKEEKGWGAMFGRLWGRKREEVKEDEKFDEKVEGCAL